MKILFSEKLNKSKWVCLKQEQISVNGGSVEVLLIKYIYIERTYWCIVLPSIYSLKFLYLVLKSLKLTSINLRNL